MLSSDKPDQAATPAVMKASNEDFSSVPSPEVRTESAPTSEATVTDEEKRATPMTMLSEAQGDDRQLHKYTLLHTQFRSPPEFDHLVTCCL